MQSSLCDETSVRSDLQKGSDMGSINGYSVLVTGGGSGIGACARAKVKDHLAEILDGRVERLVEQREIFEMRCIRASLRPQPARFVGAGADRRRRRALETGVLVHFAALQPLCSLQQVLPLC